jgi:hypothetical protein
VHKVDGGTGWESLEERTQSVRPFMSVRKQQLRDEADAKRAKGSPSALSPSHLPEVALDLHVVFGSADDVSSGDEPMGDHDHTADAASAPPRR